MVGSKPTALPLGYTPKTVKARILNLSFVECANFVLHEALPVVKTPPIAQHKDLTSVAVHAHFLAYLFAVDYLTFLYVNRDPV